MSVCPSFSRAILLQQQHQQLPQRVRRVARRKVREARLRKVCTEESGKTKPREEEEEGGREVSERCVTPLSVERVLIDYARLCIYACSTHTHIQG